MVSGIFTFCVLIFPRSTVLPTFIILGTYRFSPCGCLLNVLVVLLSMIWRSLFYFNSITDQLQSWKTSNLAYLKYHIRVEVWACPFGFIEFDLAIFVLFYCCCRSILYAYQWFHLFLFFIDQFQIWKWPGYQHVGCIHGYIQS